MDAERDAVIDELLAEQGGRSIPTSNKDAPEAAPQEQAAA